MAVIQPISMQTINYTNSGSGILSATSDKSEEKVLFVSEPEEKTDEQEENSVKYKSHVLKSDEIAGTFGEDQVHIKMESLGFLDTKESYEGTIGNKKVNVTVNKKTGK